MNMNPFLDQRKIPEININFRVKINSTDREEINNWNIFFSELMKKPKTKLTFTTCSILRDLPVSNITLDTIKDYISEDDYKLLYPIEDLFNNRLEIDLKIFILSLLKIPISILKN